MMHDFRKLLTSGIVATMTAAAVLPGAVFADQADDFAAAEETAFAEVEMAYRPYARWWLAEGSHTDETLKESVKELYDAGYGGLEFVTLTSEAEFLDDTTYGWGSPEWIHDTKVILEECSKYGMSVSMTGGTYWATANLPTINPDQEEASQELGYTTIQLMGEAGSNTSYQGELPQCILPGEATQQNLVTVVAAKVDSWGTSQEEIDAANEGASEGESAGESAGIEIVKHVLDTDSLQVVADKVAANEDGTYSIDYTAEDDGDYILFAFYQYGTSESYAAANTGSSYTINYLDPVGAQALIAYWDENVLTDGVMELIDQIDEVDLYMDSLELVTQGPNSTKQLWCKDMLDQFETRRGYSLGKYLPLMIRETTDALGGMGQQIEYVYDFTDPAELNIDYLRNDFFQTETELYKENCLEPLHTWLNSKGMSLRAENSYGKTFELSQTVSAVDYLETESFEFAAEIDSYRNFSGPAHVYGKRLSSETGASILTNYKWNNGYYRQIFYTQYASGIQKTVTHGYSSEYGPEASVTWPGYEGMTNLIAERFNKRQPGFVDYPEVNAHLSRIQKALEQGVPQVDIAMLRNDYYLNNMMVDTSNAGIETNQLHNDTAAYWMNQELQNNGYTYEYFSPYVLLDDVLTVEDGVVNADGAAYRALIVMEDELPLSAAEKLLNLVKSGVKVIFVNNVVEKTNNNDIPKVNTIAASTTGCNDGQDDALAEVVNEIKDLENVKVIDNADDTYETLKELGVSPRVEYAEANAQILTVLRKAENASYLYVYNYKYETADDYNGTIYVEGEYQPYILDTWSGKVTKYADAQTADGKTGINITIAPGDVQMYILDPAAAAAGETIESSDPAEIELTGWNLVVDSFVPGERIERTEENAETNVTTTEVTFATDHVMIEAGVLEALVPWNQIEALGDTVSGIGTYTTNFIIPEEYDGGKVTFKADSFNYGTAMVSVNGEQVPVNMDTGLADITEKVHAGENTIAVRVTSSLRNIALTQPNIFWLGITGTQPDSYGMTGKTVITVE